MFPRIRKSNKNGNTYEYLVISESTYEKGKVTSTRNVANLGNIKNFKTKNIDNLISGPTQKEYFNMVGIKNPQNLEKFI